MGKRGRRSGRNGGGLLEQGLGGKQVEILTLEGLIETEREPGLLSSGKLGSRRFRKI